MTTELDPKYKKQFEKDLNDIIYEVRHYYPNFGDKEIERLREAFWFAEEAHRDQKRFSGEPYFIHPVAATKILLQIQPDMDTISACLLHDVIEDTKISAEIIEQRFGQNVKFLCEGVEKITKVRLQGKEREVESLRKLLIAMAKDIRVIFIKLADRIHNLDTLDHVREEKRQRIAKESLEVYVPVADRLGIHEFKVMMEDLCFKNLEPEAYQSLLSQIKQTQKERQDYIEKAQKEIRKLLTRSNITFETVGGRDKNIYSVHQKLKRKNYNQADEIHDLLGVRVIVEDTTDCYRVLGIIHAQWKPIPGRFKDYIAVPKANGYKSLHTTVLGLAQSKIPTEIQIRTRKMHMDAEFGPAAHWAYKISGGSNLDEDYQESVKSWIPEDITENFEQSSEKFFQQISQSLNSNRIMVFTPKGDIKNLKRGSTLIDFAYAIHTDVGDSCIGAKVNGIIKPLDYILKGGEVVEVLTKKGRKPNPAWLEFSQSASARQKIQRHINKTQKVDQLHQKLEKEAVSKKKVESKPSDQVQMRVAEKNLDLKKFSIIIGGEEGLSYRFAKCCSPNPHKNIIAYNTRGRDFVIHDAECSVYKKLDPARSMEAYFIIQKKFSIYAKDRKGLMRDYSNTISSEGIFIWDIKFKRLKNNMVVWTFVINLRSDSEYDAVKKKILALDNVIEIKEKK